VYVLQALLSLSQIRDWAGGGTSINVATSIPRIAGVRALFALKFTGADVPGTSKSPAIEVKGKERKVCNHFRIHARDLFGSEAMGEVGKVDCFIPGVMGRGWYNKEEDGPPVAEQRKRVGTTSAGLISRFQNPISLSQGPDKWVLVLYFDDSPASNAFWPVWQQGVDRVSGKMKFDERAGTQTTVALQQINCDEEESREVCSGGPALFPSVMIYQRGGARSYAILPDDIEEVLGAITQWVKKISAVPRSELKWPMQVQGWVRLPSVPGQISVLHNSTQVALNEAATLYSASLEHFMFETDKGMPLANRFSAVPKAKRKILSPLIEHQLEIKPSVYTHFYSKLVPATKSNDHLMGKIEYQQSTSGFRQAQKQKQARAAFRLNYDISSVGFMETSTSYLKQNSWYDLACKLAGLATGGYLVHTLVTEALGAFV
jgi:hypothetical protein